MKMEDENEDEWQMVPLFEVRASFEVVQLLFISSFPSPQFPEQSSLNYVCASLWKGS